MILSKWMDGEGSANTYIHPTCGCFFHVFNSPPPFYQVAQKAQCLSHLHAGPTSFMSASRCLPTPAALSPAENGRHHRRGREAPPRPAPRGATAAAVRGLRAPPATSRATGPVLPGTRVARPRRGPARRRGGRGGGRDRVLAGELLHVAGALRALRAGAVVAHQALRQVQGPRFIHSPASRPLLHPHLLPTSSRSTRARRCSEQELTRRRRVRARARLRCEQSRARAAHTCG